MNHPDAHTPTEQKKLATWGTDIPDDLVLDDKQLAEALKKVCAFTTNNFSLHVDFYEFKNIF